MADGFAPRGADLNKIGVASYPTPGQAFALEADGSVPSAVKAKLAGYEFAYASWTTDVSLTASAEASATTIVTAAETHFDGGTTVIIEIFSEGLYVASTASLHGSTIALFDNGVSQGAIGAILSPAPGQMAAPYNVSFKTTPTLGAHTYSVRGWKTSADSTSVAADTAIALAGAGGAGNRMPGYLRIVRAN